MRAVPGRGIGYGVLRYLSTDTDLTEALEALPAPQILVNYTGHGSIERPTASTARFTLPPRQLTSGRDADRPRAHLLEINGGVHDGQLHVHWTFSAGLHHPATIEGVARSHLAALTRLVEAARGRTGADRSAPQRSAPATFAPSAPAVFSPSAPATVALSALPSPAAVMAAHHVPGTVVALVRDNEVAAVTGYGALAADATDQVSADTLFQVGSISKHVTALGVLRLVDQGALDLDADVEDYLTSWRLPRRGVSGEVTPRRLLSHVAGLTVARNSGYRPGEPLPTLLDLLDGRVADTPPVTMELPPGEAFRKSNAHYWVLEQLMQDVSGEPFAELMRRLIFAPLGLDGTSFDQSFPQTAGLPVARGHTEDGTPVPGGWRVKPVLSSTGLWSTAPDLARLLIAVRRAYLGDSTTLLPQGLARQLLTVGHPEGLYGLGTSVDDFGADLEFGHVGESVGYRAMMIGRMRSGSGFVVLTNADSGKEVHRFVATHIGAQEGRQFGQGQAKTELGYR
jgi:non-ribosomal peptide synthase protein (TIGR01720 family)